MITIFYAYLDGYYQQLLIDNYMQQFSVELQQRLSNYHRWQDVQATILGRLFIKQGIKLYNIDDAYDEIVYNNYGKPLFKQIPYHFNISHTNNIVVCAFSDEEIGIDIEKIINTDIDVLKPHFTKAEWIQIQTSKNKHWEFYNFWTKKEAILKLIGKGLSMPPNLFEVLDNDIAIVENKNIFLKQVIINNDFVCNIATFLNPGVQNIKQIFIEELLQ